MYQEKDNRHYDYFDYLDDDGKKHKYEPDSDMDFVEFKERILAEWNKGMKTAPVVFGGKGYCCWT